MLVGLNELGDLNCGTANGVGCGGNWGWNVVFPLKLLLLILIDDVGIDIESGDGKCYCLGEGRCCNWKSNRIAMEI